MSGGAEGPAARAAAQAARAGAAAIAAGSAGWAAVGGAEHLHAVLHELVTLPLQVRSVKAESVEAVSALGADLELVGPTWALSWRDRALLTS